MIESEFGRFIERLAAESQEIILQYYAKSDMEIERKSDDSPVTIADRTAEERLRELIESVYPSHGIVGEEFPNVREDAEFVWTLDPIDGTKTFMSACPLFGTLIGLQQGGEPVLGAINLPALNQLFVGDNQQTRLNGKQIRNLRQNSIEECTLLCTSVSAIGKYKKGTAFDELHRRAKMLRTWGDCYGYTLVAAGWADIMLDPIMNPWDLIPLIPVMKGAGCAISSWEGEDPATANSAIACSQNLHHELVEILNRQGND